jgi:Leucine-rich repeat (LRR) protein
VHQVPGEISQCTALESLSLEGNKLTAPLLDLRALSSLRSLQLSGNPIEFLPELSPCVHLRHLTLANVRLAANATMDDVRAPPPPALRLTHCRRLPTLQTPFTTAVSRGRSHHTWTVPARQRLGSLVPSKRVWSKAPSSVSTSSLAVKSDV